MTAPPGSWIVRWAARTFGADVADRVFVPLVADWQHEWIQAVGRMARGRATLHGWRAVTVCAARVAVQVSWPRRQDGVALRRSLVKAALFTASGMGLLLAPFAPWWLSRGAAFGWLVPYLLPQTLALALPFALLPAALTLGASATPGRAWPARAVLTATTALVVVGLLGLHGFAVPDASRAFRTRLSTRTLPASPRELNLPALRVMAVGASTGSGYAATELRRRLAMAVVWPPALAMLGWRLGRHRGTATSGALTLWWAGVIGMAAAFQPRLEVQTALQAMAVLETPETTVAAIWLLMAAAFRPRRASAPVASR